MQTNVTPPPHPTEQQQLSASPSPGKKKASPAEARAAIDHGSPSRWGELLGRRERKRKGKKAEEGQEAVEGRGWAVEAN